MADTDIGRELCAKVKAVFDSRIAGDTTIAAIRKKVEDGRATMNDMSVYSRQLGMRLRQAIESTVHPENLPDETMYQNIAHSILDPLLRENYDEINRICAETQRELDRKARIGLAPQAAEYPAERVMTASFGAAAKGLASDAVKVLGRTSENITASASDEYMKTNAEYRSKAGLDAYIVRTDGAGCCKWCAALAGKFKYPDDIPDDVFRRHDNCTCDVSYVSSKGVQNVHTKKWTQVNEPRKIEYNKPTKRTRAEAKAKEAELLGYYIKSSSEIHFSTVNNSGKVDKKLLSDYRKEYDKFTETFRDLPILNGFSVKPYKTGTTTFGAYNPYSHEITLIGIGGKSGRGFITQTAIDEKKRGQWSTSSPFHSFRHELGHALQAQLESDDPEWSRKRIEIEAIFNGLNEQLTNLEESDIIAFKKKRLSIYGFDSVEEFISESVAEYADSPRKCRSTAKQVINILLQ